MLSCSYTAVVILQCESALKWLAMLRDAYRINSLVSEVQKHSCEWFKFGSEKGMSTPPTVALVLGFIDYSTFGKLASPPRPRISVTAVGMNGDATTATL